MDNLAIKLCNKSGKYDHCSVNFWSSPDKLNYIYSGGIIPTNTYPDEPSYTGVCAHTCENYVGGGIFSNNNGASFPTQTIKREEVTPGIQLIGSERNSSLQKTLYLSYTINPNDKNCSPNILGVPNCIENYSNQTLLKDSQIKGLYFYADAKEAAQHSDNYAYNCTPPFGTRPNVFSFTCHQ